METSFSREQESLCFKFILNYCTTSTLKMYPHLMHIRFQVSPDSPSERGGLRMGDVLVAVNGKDVQVSQS